MARYEHLPIFADAYRLAPFVEQQVAGFSYPQRPAIGANLRAQTLHLLRLVIDTNNRADKRPRLELASRSVKRRGVPMVRCNAGELAPHLPLPVAERRRHNEWRRSGAPPHRPQKECEQDGPT